MSTQANLISGNMCVDLFYFSFCFLFSFVNHRYLRSQHCFLEIDAAHLMAGLHVPSVTLSVRRYWRIGKIYKVAEIVHHESRTVPGWSVLEVFEVI